MKTTFQSTLMLIAGRTMAFTVSFFIPIVLVHYLMNNVRHLQTGFLIYTRFTESPSQAWPKVCITSSHRSGQGGKFV
jgi:hypothetical protein